MAVVNKGIGVAGVFNKGLKAYSRREEVQAASAKNKLTTNTANAMNTDDAIQLEVDALKAQNKKIVASQAQTETDSAFRLYSATGKVGFLKKLIKSNSTVNRAWLNIVSLDTINPEQDQKVLASRGITSETFNSFNHLKALMPDGNELLYDVGAMMQGTGYLNRIQDEELDYLLKYKKILGGGSGGGKDTRTSMQKNAAAYAEHEGKKDKKSVGFMKLFREDVGGNTAGRQDLVREAKANLDTMFKEEGGFLASDSNQPGWRAKAEDDIQMIMDAGKVKLDDKDKVDLKSINTLLSMAGQFENNVSPEITGIVDNLVNKAESYIMDGPDNIDTEKARAAYASYSNLVRHALFGSALTRNEQKLFDNAYGTLNLKYPAVLARFQSAVTQLKSKLTTISNLNHSFVSKYYVGASRDKVSEIIVRLDERLEFLARYEKGGDKYRGSKDIIPTNIPATTTAKPADNVVEPTVSEGNSPLGLLTDKATEAATDVKDWLGEWSSPL